MENTGKKIKTIAIVAPSGCIKNSDEINSEIALLEKHFKIKKYYDENVSNYYLSDTTENRVKYFENAFSDSEVDLVISVRGGFGALKIVDKINYDLIKDCNKYYVGSSDASILLVALSKKTNIKCFHGLMISNGFVENYKKNIEIIENNIFNLNLEKLNNGKPKGILWGGNLSSIVSLLSGESYIPNKDIILFVEDLNEPLYKIDKMLYEILRYKALKEKIKGIIFGDFYFERNEIMPLITYYINKFNVPCYLTNQITHKSNNVTIPFGIDVELD